MSLIRKKKKAKKSVRVSTMKKPKSSILADEMGEQYTELTDAIKSSGDSLGSLKKRIIEEAEETGKEEGSSKLIKGLNYTVGFTNVAASSKVDIDLVKQYIPKKYHKKIFRKVEVLDEVELANLFEVGELDADLVDDIMVQKSSSSKRVVVKRR